MILEYSNNKQLKMNTQQYLKKILTEKLVGNDLNLIKNITNFLPQYKYKKTIITDYRSYQLEKYGWLNDSNNSGFQLTEFYFPDIDITLFTIAHNLNSIDIEDIIDGALMDIECYDDDEIENTGDLQEYYFDNFELFYKYSYMKKIYEHHQKIIKHRKYLENLIVRLEDLNIESDDESTSYEQESGTIDLDISDISSSDEDSDSDNEELENRIREIMVEAKEKFNKHLFK